MPHAIRYFLRQDYPNKELVIIDDGVKAAAELIPADPRIRYFRLSQKQPIGTKRNLACEAARGKLIAHWDDDDWFSARRLSYQVGAMLSAEGEVCGLRQMLFYKIAAGKTWLYRLPSAFWNWLIGGSLIYTRDFWRRGHFPPVWVGEDTIFISNHFSKDALKNAVYLSDFSIYVALVHSNNNTSSHNFRGPSWMPWRGDLAGIMGDDLKCYPPLFRRRIR
ncbi:MAG: glycosyltransferase family 2 protein [Blastocatellia bacterium]|nr:glycosyltransferase family 2 protein [Blastocatellia bacterium]